MTDLERAYSSRLSIVSSSNKGLPHAPAISRRHAFTGPKRVLCNGGQSLSSYKRVPDADAVPSYESAVGMVQKIL